MMLLLTLWHLCQIWLREEVDIVRFVLKVSFYANLNVSSEVFDKTCKKFVTLKTPKLYFAFAIAISVESKIFALEADTKVYYVMVLIKINSQKNHAKLLKIFVSILLSKFLCIDITKDSIYYGDE